MISSTPNSDCLTIALQPFQAAMWGQEVANTSSCRSIFHTFSENLHNLF